MTTVLIHLLEHLGVPSGLPSPSPLPATNSSRAEPRRSGHAAAVTTATAAKGARMITADSTAPVTGRRTAHRRTTAWLACAAFTASSASARKSIDSGMPAASPG